MEKGESKSTLIFTTNQNGPRIFNDEKSNLFCARVFNNLISSNFI